MTGMIFLTVVVVVLATHVSSVSIALMTVSRSALEERLARANRQAAADWFFAYERDAWLAVALIRTALRLLVFVVVLIDLAGVGPDVTISYGTLLGAGGLSLVILWVTTTIIATALARHAGAAMVAGTLPLIRGLTTILLPATRGLAFIDEAIRRLSGANLREREEAESELLRSIDDTHREGNLDRTSAALLENVVEFSSTDVGEVMTPRTDIDGIELNDDLDAIRTFIVESGHSRIPVYEENLDHIVGVLYVKDLVPYLGTDASGFELRPLLRQPIVVPETKQVGELLGDFQRGEVHMAMVIDEYGGTAGLVTIEDVIEEIVGEIHDEHDVAEDEEPRLYPIDDRRTEVDGRYHIDDLNEHLDLTLPEDDEFDTVAGYVLSHLGRVPKVGETFDSEGARFTTLEATATHVQRVGIELLG